MRPLKLTLRGINSYRKEQVIDFEALTSAGLFGIFGPTGSGKSSILDAITLALYAKLPRSTKNFIHINEETAAITFVFSITTTETLCYQVERTFRYHKGGSAVTVHNTGATLAEVTRENPRILADRPTEVTQECTRLLGLNSDDFMRTVVLPQGQFSEFLKLKNAERRSMLQRIFHLEEYGLALTQKIASARQKQELLLSHLAGQLKAFEDVSAERLEELRKNHALLLEAIKESETQKQRTEQVFQEADAIRALIREYEPVRARYEESLRELPSVEEKEKRAALGKRAAQVRPFAMQADKSRAETKLAASTLQQIQEALSTLQTSCQQLLTERDSVSEAYHKKLPEYLRQEQKICAAIERRNTILDWKKKLSETEAHLRQKKEALSALHAQEQASLQSEKQLQADMEAKEAEAVAIRPSREEMNALEQGHILEETYREKRILYEEAKKQANTLQRTLDKEQDTLASLTRQITDLSHSIRHALAQAQHRQTTLRERLSVLSGQKLATETDIQKLQSEHMALILRSRLQEGDVCPVCGNIHHVSFPENTHRSDDNTTDSTENSTHAVTTDDRSPDDDDTLTRIEELRTQMETFATREKELEAQSRETEQQIAAFSMHLDTLRHLLPELSEEENPIFSDLDTDTVRLHLQTLSTEYPACRERTIQINGQYVHLQEQNAEQYRTLQDAAEEILALRKQWKTENFTRALSEKRTAEKKYDHLQEELLRLRQKLETLRQNRETLTRDSMTLSGQLASAENTSLHYRTLIEEEEKKYPAGYSSGTDYDVLLEQTKEKRTALEQRKATLDEQYQKATLSLQAKKEEQSAAMSRLQLCKANQRQAEETLREQLQQSGFSPDTILHDEYLSAETIREMETEAQTFRENFARIRERLSYLEEKKRNQTMTEEEWTAKKEAMEQAAAILETQRKEEAVLAKETASCHRQLRQKQTLEKQQTEALHRRGLIRQLEQLFKGNAFIEYVSESRLRYIASEASVILSSISNGNYALEINEHAEFIIRDNKNGGILRPCDTLSGGETFITSLALALALSSVIQLNGTAPLELFFLDEGFGNLDDELLDVVMTSLERLRSTRRSIGVITHVEAIQARVPVKLIVTPSEVGSVGSSIRMEYS